jgi:hypothetical protein
MPSKVKDSVFASRAEEENYYKLISYWGKQYRIYHNLPFLNIFEPDEIITRDGYKFSYLKKTSIDYVLCGEKNKPLICIEYDGLQEGFSFSDTYKSRGNQKYVNRKECFELKQQIAAESNLPFLIIGSNEFKNISEEVSFSIADGIIGEVIGEITYEKEIHSNYYDYEQEYLKETGLTRDDYFDKFTIFFPDGDICVDDAVKELKAHVKSYTRRKIKESINPISLKLRKIKEDLNIYSDDIGSIEHRKELVETIFLFDYITGELVTDEREKIYYQDKCQFKFSVDPLRYGNHGFSLIDSLCRQFKKYPDELQNFLHELEVECLITTRQFGIVKSAILLPNFCNPHFNTIVLAMKIVELLTLYKIRDKLYNA